MGCKVSMLKYLGFYLPNVLTHEESVTCVSFRGQSQGRDNNDSDLSLHIVLFFSFSNTIILALENRNRLLVFPQGQENRKKNEKNQ